MTAPAWLAGSSLALWGGFECSVTRIGDVWRDQVRETGHHGRETDLGRAAALGVRAVRYPLVWERVSQDETDEGELPWHDRRIEALRRLGVGIIAGLLHHGSGPPGVDLLHPDFPERLAAHAGRMARRYPDIALWVPVNEPLTTARFGCLYGVWHPHRRDTAAFLRATAAQCHAVLLSMRAIRAEIPDARLLQTEDLARTFATGPLASQARYENERRWLSLDLLCGRVGPQHPWHEAFLAADVPSEQLRALAGGEAAPDVIGANYYVTSERYLDHRTALYPRGLRGGNGRDTYSDTEAVRVALPAGLTGWEPRLRELWDRYGVPIAMTEVQLGTDDQAEQVRWFAEAWDAALTLRAEGVDIRAVTAWALAGAVDWDSLMRERRGHLECGAWDIRGSGQARLLAEMLQAVAGGGRLDLDCLQSPGWWRSEERYSVRARNA